MMQAANGETYRRVRFARMKNQDGLPYFALSVNGQQIRIQRGVPVVLPSRFVELADMSGCYPYTDLGSATYADYAGLLASGNRKVNESLKKLQERGWPRIVRPIAPRFARLRRFFTEWLNGFSKGYDPEDWDR